MNFLQKISAVWQNVSLVQRALLLAIFLTFVIGGAFLSHWVSRPDMGVLYSNLDPEEAGKITDKISEKSIPYELRNGGTSIYVPKSQVAQVRLDMAKEGLPSDGQKGYGIFDNEKIGVSPAVQDINLKRALQEELAKSIQMIEGVVRARIHIVSPKQSIFSSQASETTTSVALKLKPGYQLSPAMIGAITHLVAGSVEGLKAENVTVVDSQGRLLSRDADQMKDGGAGSVLDYRERVEQNLASKVEEMLAAVLGPGRATVKVSAVIDMTQVNLVTEKYDPTGKVATKEEMKSHSETDAAASQAASGGVKKEETNVFEYAVGKIVEQKVEMPGKIKSLQVAAVVDLSPVKNAADANKAEAAGTEAAIMKVSDVEEIIKNALGLTDSDSLKVVEAKFNRAAEPVISEDPGRKIDYVAIAGQGSLGIMAICALAVLKMLGGAAKKKGAVGGHGQLAAGQAAAGMLPSGMEESDPLMLRRQIAGALQSNPEQVRELFTNWLTEKGA